MRHRNLLCQLVRHSDIIFSIWDVQNTSIYSLVRHLNILICLCTSNNMKNHIAGSYGHHGGCRGPQKSSVLTTMLMNYKQSNITYYFTITWYIHHICILPAGVQAGAAPCWCTGVTPSTPKDVHESWLMGNQRRIYLVKYAHSMDWWTTLILCGLHRSEREKRVVCVFLCFAQQAPEYYLLRGHKIYF